MEFEPAETEEIDQNTENAENEESDFLISREDFYDLLMEQQEQM